MLAAMLVAQGSGIVFGQAVIGDLDANHEVSLSDVTDFVRCLTGPDDASVTPSCAAALFDADDDVDLRDVAAFQNRFGFGVGPPRIDRFWPTPGTWIVDDVGLTHIQVGFSEPVIVPDGSVNVWVVSRLSVDGGDVTDFTTSYDDQTFALTVTFAEPLKDDRVTIVVDYLIEDLAGNPLDGEIYDPPNAQLPSGNGVNGGQGVFRIHVLQGDANRDGMTDTFDLKLINEAIGVCSADPGFDPRADLNSDGCVNDIDVGIFTQAQGRGLSETDGTGPAVIDFAIDAPSGGVTSISFTLGERIAFRRVRVRTCFLVGLDGSIWVPSSAGTPPFATAAVYSFSPPLPTCVGYTINLSNALADLSGELLTAPESEPCP